jgi:hypothetical protein
VTFPPFSYIAEIINNLESLISFRALGFFHLKVEATNILKAIGGFRDIEFCGFRVQAEG